MFTDEWGKLRGLSFDGYRLTSLVSSSSDRALFRATNAAEVAYTIGFREAADQAEADTIVNRFQEAAFFEHPNLARIFDVGMWPQQAALLVYWVTEPQSYTLAEVAEAEFRGSSLIQVLRRIAPSLIAGLQFLHNENFIYCALNPKSVWLSGDQWKLTDFSELRIIGVHDRLETRRLMTRRDLSCPPESYQGTVDKPWDAWSLGSLLHEVLGKLHDASKKNEASSESEIRTGQVPLISADCNYLISELMDPEPSQRLTLAGFQERLASMFDTPEIKRPILVSPRPSHGMPTATRPIPFPQSGTSNTFDLEVEAMEREEHSRRQNKLLAGALAAFLAITAVALTFSQKKPQPVTHKMAVPEQVTSGTQLNGPAKPTPFSIANSGADSRENTRQAVLAVLRQWVKSTLARNVDQQISCYAPVLDRYYGRRNMMREQLKEEKRKLFSQVGNIQDFTLSQVQFRTLSAQSVVIVANKTWDFPERRYSGAVQEELVLRPVNGEWKIASERDLRTNANTDSAALDSRSDRFKLPAPITADPEAMIAGARP